MSTDRNGLSQSKPGPLPISRLSRRLVAAAVDWHTGFSASRSVLKNEYHKYGMIFSAEPGKEHIQFYYGPENGPVQWSKVWTKAVEAGLVFTGGGQGGFIANHSMGLGTPSPLAQPPPPPKRDNEPESSQTVNRATGAPN